MSKREERLQLIKEILWRPGVAIVLALYGLVQLPYNIIAWLMSADTQAKYQLINLLSWRFWLIVTPTLTLLLIALIIRSAFRVIDERDAKHESEVKELRRKYIRRRRRINRKFMAERATLGQYAKELSGANFEKGKLEDELLSLRDRAASLETEKSRLESQLEDLNKLRLVVNARHQSEVRMEVDEGGTYVVTAYLKLSVENHAVAPVPIKKLETFLYRDTGRGIKKEVPRSRALLTALAYADELAGHEAGAGRETAPAWFHSEFDMPPRYWKLLNHTCFLRVTMWAMRQPPYSIDLDVDWKALEQHGKVFVTPRK